MIPRLQLGCLELWRAVSGLPRPYHPDRNLADKETNKERDKQRNRSKTIPCPPIGVG